MTVNYMKEAATIHPWTYLKILFRWRGSIWKSVFSEMIVWLALYSIISLIYRIVLFGTHYGSIFEELVTAINYYLKTYGSTLNFVAAFYISYINARWWWLYTEIPWPDNLYMLITALMKSNGHKRHKYERQLRLAIGRYYNLAFVLLFRDICASTKKRFPTLNHLCPSLATKEEISLLKEADTLMGGFQQTCLYSLPLDWIQKIIKKAGDDGNFLKSHMTALHEEVVRIRSKMYNLLAQDFICAIPISLTQIAIAAPVTYFLMSLIGKQFIVILDQTATDKADYIIPFYTLYEFIIYIGWMKAAMTMLNPFGNDDDDFEVDYLINRNNTFSRVVLDELFDKAPTPKDIHFNPLPQSVIL